MLMRNWHELDDLLFKPWLDLFRYHPTFGAARTAGWDGALPRVNVWTNDDAVLVTAEAAGVDPSSLDLSVQDNTLTIRGERQPLSLADEDTYHHRERCYGTFERTVELPFQVDVERVSASLRDGVLEVQLPRAENDKPRRIQVTAG